MSNKSIILTETELKAIIKDTVNETLNSYQKNLMNDFRQIFHPASFDNPLTYLMRKPIEEGITKTYPIDITIRYINDYFNKYHLNVFIRKGSTLTKDEKIIIEFPNTNDNFNIIDKALNLCGYYLGFPKEDEIVKNKNLWLTLEYEPRHQSDDTKQIKEEELTKLKIKYKKLKNKIEKERVEEFKTLKPFKNLYDIPDIPHVDKKTYNEIIIPNLVRCGAIPKKDLIIGKTYIGECHNASEAVWNGHTFVYERYKFGDTFDEEINHFEDVDGYDLFVPIKLKE